MKSFLAQSLSQRSKHQEAFDSTTTPVTSFSSSDTSFPKLDSQISLSYVFEYLFDGRTTARLFADSTFKKLLPLILGNHSVVEMGSGSEAYYAQFAPKSQCWIGTDYEREGVLQLDATQIDLPDNSVSAYASVYMLEHIVAWDKAISEIHRTLKPKGRALIIVPFLSEYHGAPYDYMRWTPSGLEKALGKFKILAQVSGGNRFTTASMFFHEKIGNGSTKGFAYRLVLRLIGWPLIIAAFLTNLKDTHYPCLVAAVVEKE